MLNHIKDTVCPDCGSQLRGVSKEDQHSNGYWNERAWFDCEKEIKFSPNFMQVTSTYPCTRKNTYKEQLEAIEKLKEELLALVTASNLAQPLKLGVYACVNSSIRSSSILSALK